MSVELSLTHPDKWIGPLCYAVQSNHDKRWVKSHQISSIKRYSQRYQTLTVEQWWYTARRQWKDTCKLDLGIVLDVAQVSSAASLPDKWLVYHLSRCCSVIIKCSFTSTCHRSWKQTAKTNWKTQGNTFPYNASSKTCPVLLLHWVSFNDINVSKSAES